MLGCGAALEISRGRLAAAGVLKLRETKSSHKAGHGRWRQDFSTLRGGGQGEGEGARSGQPVKSLPEVIGEAHRRAGCTECTQSRPRAPKQAPANPGRAFAHCVRLNTDAEFIPSSIMLQKHP